VQESFELCALVDGRKLAIPVEEEVAEPLDQVIVATHREGGT
jgi:hypothetical protein